MTTITPQLQGVYSKFSESAPDAVKAPVMKSREELMASFDMDQVIKVGDKLPDFSMPDAVGNIQNSSDLLSQNNLVISFFRGSWCPFCNIAIHGLQVHLDEFKARGVKLVVITPERPDDTLSMVEKHELKFPVLTDLHNEFAHKLGIVWKQPEYLRPVFENFNHNLPVRNGDDSFELPIPATLLVDKEGIVRNVYSEPDYVKRVEPKTVLQWIDEL